MFGNKIGNKRWAAMALVLLLALIAACAPPAPEVVEKEVVVEKPVVETVIVEKEVVVEKPVVETVIVEKEVVVEPAPTLAPQMTDPNTLLVVMWCEPAGIDPAIYRGDTLAGQNVYETLVRTNPPGSEELVRPHLAESYEVFDDGLVWTFHLRQGVKTHSGGEFTAEAVKYSVERTLEAGGSPARFWKDVEDMEVVDRYTIRFTLKEPVPFATTLGSRTSVYMLDPEPFKENEVEGDLGQKWALMHASGTGPYKLVSWDPGEQMVFEKFDEYWGGWEGKHVETIIVRFTREFSTARLILESGDADVIIPGAVDIPVGDALAMRELPGVTVYIEDSMMGLYFTLAHQKEPTNNVKVRQALAYATDYDKIIDTVLYGYGRQLQGPLPYGMWTHDDDLPMYSFDLDKARQLLEEAGYSDGFEVVYFYTTGSEAMRQAAEIMQNDWRKLGVDLILVALPRETLRSKARGEDSEQHPHMVARWFYPSAVDPFYYFDTMYHSLPAPLVLNNYGQYKNPEFDEIVDRAHALSATDPEKAEELFKEAQRIHHEDAVDLDLYQQSEFWLMSAWVKGFEYNQFYPRQVFFYELFKEP